MRIFVAYLCAFILVFASCASGPGGAAGASGNTHVSGGGNTGQIPVEIKSKVLFADGALDEYTESEYDDSLQNLQKQRRFSASGTLLEQIEYAYPEGKNTVLRKTTRDADNQLKNQVDYQYNDRDLLVSEILTNKDGKPVSSYSYSYDEKGNRAKRVFNNASGIKMAETAYSYDNKGNMTAAETFSGAGQKINSTQCQYDNAGHMTDQKILNANGQLTSSTVATWHGDNEIKVEQSGSDGSAQMRITNEFGSNGELLKRTIEDLRGKTTQILAYEYTFKPVSR